MTLLFMDSFQEHSTIPKPEWGGAGFTASATGRDGVANGASGGGGGTTKTVTLPTSAATVHAGIAVNPNALNQVVQPLIFCTSGPVQQIILLINSSGFVEARLTTTAGTLLGTTSGHAALVAGSWRHVGATAVLHTSAGSLTVYIDGVACLTLSGIATSTVSANCTHVRVIGNNSTGNTVFDDMWVCDAVSAVGTQGQANNTFLGDLRVAVQLPSAAGDSTQWTPSTGSNFAAVDENPVNTTDYVSDSVSGHRDLYQTVDTVGTIGTVYAVREGIYAQKSDSGLMQIKPVIKENSTVTSDSAQTLAAGSWLSAWGDMKAVKPSNSGVWTQTDLDALQVGVEVA